MEWIAAALVFIFFMHHWPKRTLVTLGIIAGLGILIGGGYALSEYLDEIDEDKVHLTILPNKTGKGFVLKIINNSSKTIIKTEYTLSIKESGHSSTVQEISKSSDRIIKPGDSYTNDLLLLNLGNYKVVNRKDVSFSYYLNATYVLSKMSKKDFVKNYEDFFCSGNDKRPWKSFQNATTKFDEILYTRISDLDCATTYYTPSEVDIYVKKRWVTFEKK